MNRDDIIRMAREAGFEVMDEGKHHYAHITDTLCHIDVAVERFAALVAAAEREECAKEISAEINDEIEDEAYCILVALLARIRARGEHG